MIRLFLAVSVCFVAFASQLDAQCVNGQCSVTTRSRTVTRTVGTLPEPKVEVQQKAPPVVNTTVIQRTETSSVVIGRPGLFRRLR